MAQIDKNMTVGDILDLDRETAVYFLNMARRLPGGFSLYHEVPSFWSWTE